MRPIARVADEDDALFHPLMALLQHFAPPEPQHQVVPFSATFMNDVSPLRAKSSSAALAFLSNNTVTSA